MPLKSFQPDLQVSVGTKTVKTYQYHALILANYSAYVDTMLSVPMKEQSTRSLTFADIEPEMWEKMISYLEPNGSRGMGTDEILEVIELYDKYQFQSGLAMCDEIIVEVLEENESSTYRSFIFQHCWDKYINLAIITHGLGTRLKCEEKLTKFVSQFLMSSLPYRNVQKDFKQELFQNLLPVVQNDKEVLEFMVISLLGREPMKMYSLEELQAIVSEDDFLDSLKKRCLAIDEQKMALDAIAIQRVDVGVSSRNPYARFLTGGFKKIGTGAGSVGGIHMRLGAMANRFYYEKSGTYDEEPAVKAIMYSADPFGTKWVISKYEDEEGEIGQLINEVCLYSWQGHGYSSLAPPKSGWKTHITQEDLSNEDDDDDEPINLDVYVDCRIDRSHY